MNLDKLFEELLTSDDENEELEAELESNTSSATPGYQTPFAFSSEEDKKKKKSKLTKLGFNVVGESIESSDIGKVRTIILQEVARIFFDLYRRRSTWER